MVYIYILKLQSNKFYVGKSNNIKFRLNNHFQSNATAWTSKYRPIKVLKTIPDCDDYDEDKYTLKYMNKYGIDNVRGGSFCRINLTDETHNTIQRMITGTNNKCFNCNEIGHFAKDCDYSSKYEEVWCCKYCNREFDSLKGTTFHENIHCKKKPKKLNAIVHDIFVNDYSSESEDTWCCEYCDKEFDTLKGATFHENVHCKKKPKKKCYTCGRDGHYSNNCYASTHKKGYSI
jgi:hypothetical protein